MVDGAHRISALLAWIWNDYGDGDRSKRLFRTALPPEQQTLADETRALIADQVGHYETFRAGLDYPGAVTDLVRQRISNLSVAHMVAQWVPVATADAAEKSFHTINDAATPLDPTERRILQSGDAPLAIAARAISHGGSGYRYWAKLTEINAERTVRQSEKIYAMLYKLPLESGKAADTLDVPVAV